MRFLPHAIFGPAAVGLSAYAIGVARMPWPRALLLIGAALAAWTLIEYLLHRYVLHFGGRPVREHGRHHAEPRDPVYVAAPLYLSIPIFVLLLGGCALAFGSVAVGGMWGVGIVLGYLAYEEVHYRTHHRPATNRLERFLKRYHMIHHFQDTDHYFGVTSPLWDWVFRTKPTHPKL